MESALSLSEAEEKRGREGGGLSLGFGSTGLQPQKLMRTGPALSFRAATSYYYDEPVRALQALPSDLRSPGIGMGMGLGGGVAGRGFPFTSAQWQELQRQALIYKHFVASVPVPPDLLLPSAARCFPEAPLHLLATNNGMVVGGGGYYRFTGTADHEPGRCRRTDGKKWRCSRDVAPGMKYCERHVHRGRPRSRKPVEAHNKNKSTSTTSSAMGTSSAPANTTSTAPALKLPFQSMEPPKEARCLDVNQEWELMHLKMGLRNEPVAVLPQYEDQFSVSYTDVNEQCYSFLNPDFPSLEEAAISEPRDPPRSFIDAWSNENPITNANKYKSPSISAAGHLALSTLTLSMSGIEEDSEQIQMGLGLSDAMAKSQASRWTGSVTAFGGGPLAEVLQSSNVTSPHNGCSSSNSSKSSCGGLIKLMGKGCCGSHEVSPQESPTRPASSPTGVLQKALVSLSDGSRSSSPTFAAAASRSEIALQWLNQSE